MLVTARLPRVGQIRAMYAVADTLPARTWGDCVRAWGGWEGGRTLCTPPDVTRALPPRGRSEDGPDDACRRALFTCLLNTALSDDPVGWGLPYNYIFGGAASLVPRAWPRKGLMARDGARRARRRQRRRKQAAQASKRRRQASARARLEGRGTVVRCRVVCACQAARRTSWSCRWTCCSCSWTTTRRTPHMTATTCAAAGWLRPPGGGTLFFFLS